MEITRERNFVKGKKEKKKGGRGGEREREMKDKKGKGKGVDGLATQKPLRKDVLTALETGFSKM